MKTINVAEDFYKNYFSSHHVARSSWKIWKDSWAGQLWIEKNKEEIIRVYEREKKRFGWCHKYTLGI